MTLLIKRIRELHGLSQQELGLRLDVSRSLVGLAENGIRQLPMVAKLKLQALSTVSSENVKVFPTLDEREVAMKYLTDQINDCKYKVKYLRRKLITMERSYIKLKNKLQNCRLALQNNTFPAEIIKYEIQTLTRRLKKQDLCEQIKIELKLDVTKKLLKVAKLRKKTLL